MRSYSRRELYALGEPLGNSATQNKLGGGRIYGGGGGGIPIISDIVDTVDDALVGLDKTVGEAVPGGWSTVGAAALAAATMGASLGATALEAGAVASADATAAGLGFSSAAEAISAGAVSAAELGLPAATTVADLAATTGSASAGWAGLGQAAGVAGGVPFGSDLGSLASNIGGTASNVASGASSALSTTDMIAQDALALKSQGLGAEQIATTLSQSYGIDQYAAANVAGMATGGSNAAQIAGVLASDYGTQMAGVGSQGLTLGDIISGAKTGSQIIGGVSKLAGGVGQMLGGSQALATGRNIGNLQADPYAAYRPQAASQLQALMANPNSVTSTPGYQFNLSQGLQGLQAQQAAQGRLVSGGALLQGQQFGQNLASQTYNDQVKTLMALSGAGQSPATGAGAQANLMASNLGSTYGGWQSIAGGLGQISNPLATLYSNYNNPSPNPTA